MEEVYRMTKGMEGAIVPNPRLEVVEVVEVPAKRDTTESQGVGQSEEKEEQAAKRRKIEVVT